MLDAVCRVKLCLSDAPLKQQTPFLPLRRALLCCLYSRFSQATSVPYGHPYRLWFTPSLRPLFLLCFPANPCRRCFLAFFRGSPLENSLTYILHLRQETGAQCFGGGGDQSPPAIAEGPNKSSCEKRRGGCEGGLAHTDAARRVLRKVNGSLVD